MGVEWAPDGKHVLSSVLYERVKVDNEFRVYNALGKIVCKQEFKDNELYETYWQPYPKGTLPKPDVKKLETFKPLEETKTEATEKPKPKKWFNPAGGSNTFA